MVPVVICVLLKDGIGPEGSTEIGSPGSRVAGLGNALRAWVTHCVHGSRIG